VGKNCNRFSTSAPASSASGFLSSPFSCRSRGSHPDDSFRAPSSAGFGTRLPTSVVERESGTAWLHLSSAKRPRILKRSLPSWCPSAPPPTESSAGASSGEQFAKRCTRVWVLWLAPPHRCSCEGIRSDRVLANAANSPVTVPKSGVNCYHTHTVLGWIG